MSTDAPRIGLTGATGVLGRSVQQWWPSAVWAPFTGDIRDATAVQRWLDGAGALDAVLHFAAIVPVAKVESDPHEAFDVNVRGTWNLMIALRDRNLWTFFASSSHVNAPTSLYGITKALAEHAATALRPVCVARIFSFSAVSQKETYLLPSLARRIRAAEPNSTLEVRGGHNVRDFLTTRAIVTAIRLLYERRWTGIVDIGSGQGITVLDLARRLAGRMNRGDLEIITRDDERTSLVADLAALHSLGWRESNVLDDLLSEIADSVT